MASIPHTSARDLLRFRLAGASCALPLEAVREIVPMAQLSRPPGLPAPLEGFLNLGRTLVAVLRPEVLFALREQPVGLYTPLIVLASSDPPLALLVERVEGIARAAAGDLAELPQGSAFHDCAEGVLYGDEVVHVLRPDRLLLEQERQRFAELRAMEKQRLGLLEPVDGPGAR